MADYYGPPPAPKEPVHFRSVRPTMLVPNPADPRTHVTVYTDADTFEPITPPYVGPMTIECDRCHHTQVIGPAQVALDWGIVDDRPGMPIPPKFVLCPKCYKTFREEFLHPDK